MKDLNVTIAVIAPQDPFDFFDQVWEGVWSAAYELAPLGVNVRTIATAAFDVGEQRSLLSELLTERIDAIVIFPFHRTGINDLIEQHAAQNTPVITMMADAPQSRRAAFVGPDCIRSGRMAGELLAKMMGKNGRVLAFPGPPEFHNFHERFEGFREGLQRVHPNVSITEVAFCAAAQSQGDFEGVYIGSSEIVNLQDLFASLRGSPPCVTFQDTDNVRNLLRSGRLSAVIDENRYHQGYIAVQKAYSWLIREPAEKDWIRVPASVVLASGIDGEDVNHSLSSTFEMLVRQRTSQLCGFKEALESANSKLLQQAETDGLTRLLNRRKYEEILAVEVEKATSESPLCLLIVDVDEFKSVNDILGHLTGDEILRRVATVLERTCRTTDFVCRIGGDEFSIILPNTRIEDAENLRSRLEQGVLQIHLESFPDFHVSASFGATTLPRDGVTGNDLSATADKDLYERKRSRPRLGREVHVTL